MSKIWSGGGGVLQICVFMTDIHIIGLKRGKLYVTLLKSYIRFYKCRDC